MSVVDPTYGRSTSWMSEQRCHDLLAAARVCRLAVIDSGKPRIVVLNHSVDGDHIMLMTSEDTTIAALVAPGVTIDATLEVDSAWNSDHVGWSVIASGTLRRVEPEERLPLPHPWRHGATGVLLALTVEEIHGLSVEAEA